MNNYITTLFNNGNNDGEITIMASNDNTIKCHFFIIKYCTDYPLDNLDGPTLNLDQFDEKIIKIIIGYMYNQNMNEIDLSLDDIVNVFQGLDKLKCKEFINVLKNNLAQIFLKELNQQSWIDYYQILYGNYMYNELNQVLLAYYKTFILTTINNDDETINFTKALNKLNQEPLYDLWCIAMSTLAVNNNKVSNDNNTLEQDIDNNDTEESENEENTNVGEYSIPKMLDLLKSDLSFKQIANLYKKERDAVITDFVKYIKKTDKGKKLDTILMKYNIIYKNDRLILEKILSAKTKTSFL